MIGVIERVCQKVPLGTTTDSASRIQYCVTPISVRTGTFVTLTFLVKLRECYCQNSNHIDRIANVLSSVVK